MILFGQHHPNQLPRQRGLVFLSGFCEGSDEMDYLSEIYYGTVRLDYSLKTKASRAVQHGPDCLLAMTRSLGIVRI